ncbi:MAG: DNA replication/repair protein RecF [Spirochaetaceae bacterium]|nr:DNA replication/repair protein RecF [Spirochaetaceae bacterium]
MAICSIKLKNFRNIKESDLKTDAPEVFFVAKNGQGKTNLLESIYFLCYGTSFRTREDSIMCHNNAEYMSASAIFKNTDEDINKIFISYDGKNKKIKFNDKIVHDRKDIIRNFPCIIFSHTDMEFVNGSPEKRRLFLDQTLSLYNPYYIDSMRNFKKILKSRNVLLKEKNTELLKIYNNQFIEISQEIQKKREEITEIFNPVFKEKFKEISESSYDIEMIYESSWKKLKTKKEISDYLESKELFEMTTGITGSGPHRDKLVFNFNNRDFSDIGSTGQMRLISLILRIMQADFYTKMTGRKPILLLDDVLLELDSGKREKVLNHLPEYEQAFFTFLPNEDYVIYNKENTIVYSVNNGVFEKIG